LPLYTKLPRRLILGSLMVASPATNIAFIALRAVPHRDPAAFWRDIATPAARICYKDLLQVVAAQLPEN
jgi:hypothetical protein